MSLTTLVLIGGSAINGLLTLALAVVAVRSLRRLDQDRERRPANPSVRQGLFLSALSNLGICALLLRWLLMRFVPGATNTLWAPLLLWRDPDLAGQIVFLACLTTGSAATLLLIRGLLAVVYRSGEGEGELPTKRISGIFELPKGLRRKA